jgi:HMG (high mobility group) box
MAKASPKKVITKEKKEKAKRGPSSFMVFSNEMRPKVIEEFGFEKKEIGNIAKKIGEKWAALSDAQKETYKKKAEALKPQ